MKLNWLTIFLFLGFFLSAQNTEKPSYEIRRTSESPNIDGLENDNCWASCNVAEHFTQYEPEPFANPLVDNKIKLCYDDHALYILAILKDNKKDICCELSARDNPFDSGTDYFTMSFDPYDDNQNGFRFVVAASGVQADAKITNNETDFSWDGIWDSKVKLNEDHWVVEVKIPFYNIRFPLIEKQIWGMQFARSFHRLGEVDTWSPMDPKIEGHVQQWGSLRGLDHIHSPIRLQFYPYLSTSFAKVNALASDGKRISGQTKTISGGLDLKYGINDAFTLDATLIPDFGQVKSDQRILNLSPFETKFEEKRPFFAEGAELFTKGNIFYSRRIGGTPTSYYEVENSLKENELVKDNPTESKLYNAIKITGRNKQKLGIGFLNALIAPTYAQIKNELTGDIRKFRTGVFTNYNVTSIDQLLKNNSSLYFTNSSTLRAGSARDANVSALGLSIRNKKQKIELQTGARTSLVFNEDKQPSTGFTGFYNLRKINGNWTGSIGQEVVGKNWDPSDLSYVQETNFFTSYINLSHNSYTPNKLFLQSNIWWNLSYTYRVEPFDYSSYNFNPGF